MHPKQQRSRKNKPRMTALEQRMGRRNHHVFLRESSRRVPSSTSVGDHGIVFLGFHDSTPFVFSDFAVCCKKHVYVVDKKKYSASIVGVGLFEQKGSRKQPACWCLTVLLCPCLIVNIIHLFHRALAYRLDSIRGLPRAYLFCFGSSLKRQNCLRTCILALFGFPCASHVPV